MTASLITTVAVVVAVLIGLPLLLMVGVARARQVPRQVFLTAAALHIASLAVVLPLTAVVLPLVLRENVGLRLMAAGAVVAVIQELVRYAGFRHLPVLRGHRNESGALAAGLGQAGTAVILSGLQLGVGVSLTLGLPRLSPETYTQLVAAGPVGAVFVGLDRIPDLALGVLFAFVVVLAIRRTRAFLLVAVLAHLTTAMGVAYLQASAPPLWAVSIKLLLGGIALGVVASLVRNRVLADPHS